MRRIRPTPHDLALSKVVQPLLHPAFYEQGCAALCYAMLCSALLCYAMLCCAMLCWPRLG
eukprot:3599880-Pyramimonas_sp.AAC.1